MVFTIEKINQLTVLAFPTQIGVEIQMIAVYLFQVIGAAISWRSKHVQHRQQQMHFTAIQCCFVV